ncbi:hypothetical protein JCM11491_000092 [Sporobolomyces phaffii]
MSLRALWKPLPIPSAQASALSRSSHGLARVDDAIYIFGGEHEPRTPVKGDLTVLTAIDPSSAVGQVSTVASTPNGGGAWPTSRVGASFVSARSNGKVYLWGGRGGKEMGTFEHERGIWEFDPAAQRWTELETHGTSGARDVPEPRSFHTMCESEGKLYLHAGCPSSGRLAQLHSLDLETLAWSRLADAPGPGRGGTVLIALPRTSASAGRGPTLARFGGFAGYELDGLDLYDVDAREWRTVAVEGDKPANRSVYVFVGLDGELEWDAKRVVAVLAMGEREGAPAELGHNGAGFFHDDAWALLEADGAFSWKRLERSARSEGGAEARGWLPSAHVSGSRIVFQGGLNEKNERLSDAWTLQVVVE